MAVLSVKLSCLGVHVLVYYDSCMMEVTMMCIWNMMSCFIWCSHGSFGSATGITYGAGSTNVTNVPENEEMHTKDINQFKVMQKTVRELAQQYHLLTQKEDQISQIPRLQERMSARLWMIECTAPRTQLTGERRPQDGFGSVYSNAEWKQFSLAFILKKKGRDVTIGGSWTWTSII